MSGVRRFGWPWALVAALLLFALLVSHVQATRAALRAQLNASNRDAAAVLAVALSQPGGDTTRWAAVAAAQFSAGRTRLLRWVAADGRVPFEMQEPPRATVAPDWFVAALPLDAAPGRASVGAAGEVQVITDTAAAQDALWSAALQATAGALLVALAGFGANLWWRRSRPAAQALAAAPLSPDAMQQLREQAAAQAEQVSQLQRQAQLDAATGVSQRRHFIGLLQQRLAEPGGPGLALLLVRVLHLDALNLRLGHQGTDQLLGAVADVLMTYVDRVPGTFAGRLNGSDFALCLPVPGVALETAESLRAALAAAPALRTGAADVVVGGVDGVDHSSASAALAAADAALARAEAGAEPDSGLVVEMHAPLSHAPTGARAWREQIGAALAEGRTQLAERPMRDRTGRELHLECSLRVQLGAEGGYQAPEHWLALARRSRLLPEVDLAAIGLALRAIAHDGRARAVHASTVSLAAPGFAAEVALRLAAAPAAARQLAIECTEGPRPALGVAALAAAAAAWRPLGVRVGVEYATVTAQLLPELQAAGVDYVKLDARHLNGVVSDAAVQGYALSLVALIHSLGMKALAAGLQDTRDVDALWALGFDGAAAPG
jgi:predicted signal transduction protein with EAL and GGDEF domain